MIVARCVFAIPTEVVAVTVKRMNTSAGAPKQIVFAEIVNFAPKHTGLRVFLGVIDKDVDNFGIDDYVVGGAENVFGFVREKFQAKRRGFGVSLFRIVREEMDFWKFLANHFPRAIGRRIVGNDNLKAGVIDLAK